MGKYIMRVSVCVCVCVRVCVYVHVSVYLCLRVQTRMRAHMGVNCTSCQKHSYSTVLQGLSNTCTSTILVQYKYNTSTILVLGYIVLYCTSIVLVLGYIVLY